MIIHSMGTVNKALILLLLLLVSSNSLICVKGSLEKSVKDKISNAGEFISSVIDQAGKGGKGHKRGSHRGHKSHKPHFGNHDGDEDGDRETIQETARIGQHIDSMFPGIPFIHQVNEILKPDFETGSRGFWRVQNPHVGVSAMQLQVMPGPNMAVWFDTTTLGDSARKLDPPGNCPVSFETGKEDCFAHAIAYDTETGAVRTLKIEGDPWCSSGGLGPNGDLIGTGGNQKGKRTVRIISPCAGCQFKERHNALGADRWYSSQQILEDGNLIVVGGRDSYSYEFLPPKLDFEPKVFDLPFLKETTAPAIDPKIKGALNVENNLYPFVFLVPDGNVFIFANNRSILINPYKGKTIREYPALPGGARNYPPSGMSALLPMRLDPANPDKVDAEVVVCGGNSPDAFAVVDPKHSKDKVFLPALQDCWRMKVLDPNAQWEREQDMPSRRTMGDLLHLPTGDLLFINGAKRGTSGWEDAEEPNLVPVLYRPSKPMGERFVELEPTIIARMYHSSSALLPDGKIIVTGSNPHQFYQTLTGPYPTDMRVELFSPPYLDTALDDHRPVIKSISNLTYGEPFSFDFELKRPVERLVLTAGDVMVTMIAPPFTTHGFSQNQRMLILGLQSVSGNQITAVAPGSGKIAPPGFYMLFLVHRGVPSLGVWIRIDKK